MSSVVAQKGHYIGYYFIRYNETLEYLKLGWKSHKNPILGNHQMSVM